MKIYLQIGADSEKKSRQDTLRNAYIQPYVNVHKITYIERYILVSRVKIKLRRL